LQTGEEPVVHSTSGTDINLPAFEAGILSAMAWAHEIPPEILMLSFNNNYSASRAAINEFKIYLDKVRPFFAASFNQSFYQQWLVNMNLKGDVSTPGFLDAWRDPNQINTFLAWTNTDWSGAIKPSVDMKKEVDAYRSMLKSGLITHDRAAKELTGTKYSKNVQRLQTENQLLANAMRPLLELEQEFGSEAVNRVMGLDSDNVVIDESGEIQVVKE
jgi:capsid protein